MVRGWVCGLIWSVGLGVEIVGGSQSDVSKAEMLYRL